MRVRWSPRARDQAGEIFDYIAQERPEAAHNIFDSLVARVLLLGDLPEQGSILPGALRTDLRSVLYGSFRIVYRVDREEVVVLGIRHTRRESNR